MSYRSLLIDRVKNDDLATGNPQVSVISSTTHAVFGSSNFHDAQRARREVMQNGTDWFFVSPGWVFLTCFQESPAGDKQVLLGMYAFWHGFERAVGLARSL